MERLLWPVKHQKKVEDAEVRERGRDKIIYSEVSKLYHGLSFFFPLQVDIIVFGKAIHGAYVICCSEEQVS